MHSFLRPLVIATTIVTLSGCKAPVNRSKPTATGGLSAKDFSKLKTINEAQTTALENVRKVSERRDHACATNEQNDTNPGPSPEWSSRTKVVGSDRCPVQYTKDWTFDPGEQKLNFSHELKAQRGDALRYRRATGAITREGYEGHRTLVGVIHYDRIEITGIGSVDVTIQTSQRYTNHKGAGELKVTVKQDEWSHVGTMRWRSGRADKVIYEVDGRSISEEGFNQLFSAYGLPEIMAKSMKMR